MNNVLEQIGTENKKQNYIDLLVCVVFNVIFWRAVPSRLFLLLNENLSVFVIAAIIIVSSLLFLILFSLGKISFTLSKQKLMFLGCSAVIFMSVLFSYNEYSEKYLIDFCKYVFVPLLFFLEVKNYKLLLQTYVIFALCSFCLLAWHPLTNFNVYFGDYMAYGFELAYPCFLGLYILDKQKKNFLTKLCLILCFIFSFLFANRSSLIGMLLFLILYEIFVEEKSFKKIFFVVLLSIVMFLVYENLESILEFFLNICEKFNIESRSILKLTIMLNQYDIETASSGRNYLYNSALSMIQDNFPFPLGVGFFETKTFSYAHNVFFDFVLNWGLLGFITIIIIHFAVIYSFFREQSVDMKILKLLFFSLWFPKLLFSTSFIYNVSFFASIILIVNADNVNYLLKIKSSNRLKKGEL